jgi:hypothetical protein
VASWLNQGCEGDDPASSNKDGTPSIRTGLDVDAATDLGFDGARVSCGVVSGVPVDV